MVQHASGQTSKRSMIAQCDRDESIAVHLRETAAVLEETAMHIAAKRSSTRRNSLRIASTLVASFSVWQRR